MKNVRSVRKVTGFELKA